MVIQFASAATRQGARGRCVVMTVNGSATSARAPVSLLTTSVNAHRVVSDAQRTCSSAGDGSQSDIIRTRVHNSGENRQRIADRPATDHFLHFQICAFILG